MQPGGLFVKLEQEAEIECNQGDQGSISQRYRHSSSCDKKDDRDTGSRHQHQARPQRAAQPP